MRLSCPPKSGFYSLVLIVLHLLPGRRRARPGRDRPPTKPPRPASSSSLSTTELAGQTAPQGKTYVLLQTEWENIHPKQKVKKSDLEGKPDRTMGVAQLREGKKEEKKEDYVDADVPYVIPNFFDHAYLLADGQTYPLDKLTETMPGGYTLSKEFTRPQIRRPEKGAVCLSGSCGGREHRFPVFRLLLWPHPGPRQGRPEARGRQRRSRRPFSRPDQGQHGRDRRPLHQFPGTNTKRKKPRRAGAMPSRRSAGRACPEARRWETSSRSSPRRISG